MRHSAGILPYRRRENSVDILLGHMGGPFWANKDRAAWSIPKGEVGAGDDPLATARREFREELGQDAPDGALIDLGTFEQSKAKTIRIWAVQADIDPATCVSNTFEMEWPKGAGRTRSFPEIDRVEWFSTSDAEEKIVKGQRAVIERLLQVLRTSP